MPWYFGVVKLASSASKPTMLAIMFVHPHIVEFVPYLDQVVTFAQTELEKLGFGMIKLVSNQSFILKMVMHFLTEMSRKKLVFFFTN